MLEDEILDGEDLVAFKKALDSKTMENVLFLGFIVGSLVLCYFGILRLSGLMMVIAFSASTFFIAGRKCLLIYYFVWEKPNLTLYTMNRFGKKEVVSYSENSIKRAIYFRLLFGIENQLIIGTSTADEDIRYVILRNVDKVKIGSIAKEIMSNKK